jgi:predicted  nucleic acid-binding Zn-ribbon protein
MVTENDLDRLRSLQDIICEKIVLEKDIQEIPKLLSTQEELLTRLKKTFIEKNQDYEKVKFVESELKNKLNEAETMRENAEKSMINHTSSREIEVLAKEISDAQKSENQYRGELLQKDRALNDLDEQLKQHTSLIESQERELDERRMGIQAEIAQKQKQIDDLLKKEKKLTEHLDSEVVFKFERIIKNKMGIGIVAIKGNVCMGCHMILPSQFANNVRQGEDYIFCPYCSRILYYEESPEGEDEFFDVEDTGALSDLEDMDEDEFDDEEDDEEESIINIDNEE